MMLMWKENGAAPTGDFPYEVADDETLEVTVETASLADYEDAAAVVEQYGDEPDPSTYGIWIPGISLLMGNALEAVGAADWLVGLINDGIVAGVGAVLGFVPQMLILFIFLAFLESCGYMAGLIYNGPVFSVSSGFQANHLYLCLLAVDVAFLELWLQGLLKVTGTVKLQ